ncbi:MAG: hypothetical protein ACK56I_35790, partial [bacterium]
LDERAAEEALHQHGQRSVGGGEERHAEYPDEEHAEMGPRVAEQAFVDLGGVGDIDRPLTQGGGVSCVASASRHHRPG